MLSNDFVKQIRAAVAAELKVREDDSRIKVSHLNGNVEVHEEEWFAPLLQRGDGYRHVNSDGDREVVSEKWDELWREPHQSRCVRRIRFSGNTFVVSLEKRLGNYSVPELTECYVWLRPDTAPEAVASAMAELLKQPARSR